MIDLAGRVVLPGFVEAHGHPTVDALINSGTLLDVRPVTVPTADDVMAALQAGVAASGDEGLYANGWDPLLQRGLPELDRRVLDEMAPNRPVAVLHNSGHSVFFNTAAMRAAGIDDDAADPPGASWRRDPEGRLSGVG